jgi:regulator of sigma E protease
MITTIIIFIVVLFVCVIAHEWGHYITAKKSGMLVEEFGFGIPPRIWGKKKGETLYSVNALPIGGFVKIAGENGIDEHIPYERQFESKPWYLKSLVLVAGVVCNIILAVVLFSVSYMIGMPAADVNGVPTVVDVMPGSPAEKAGISLGTKVTKALVGGREVAPLDTTHLHEAIVANDGGPITLSYSDGSAEKTATLIPGADQKIGLAVEGISNRKESFTDAIVLACNQTIATAATIFTTLAHLIGGLFHESDTGLSGLMGPVGLAHQVGGAAKIGFAYLLAFTGMISINLAVLNIMPFPALDGGRLLVVILEAITRRKFSRTVVTMIHAGGFLLLLGLMVYLTVGDIGRLL